MIFQAIPTPEIDWVGLSPALASLAGAAVALLGSVLVPVRARRTTAAVFAGLGVLGTAVAAVYVFWKTPDAREIVGEAATRDRLAAMAQIVLGGVGLLSVFVAWSDRRDQEHVGEYYALLAAAVGGMAFMVQANNLMTLFLGLEWFSLCLYVLCAIDIDLETSLESGLKYLIVGSFGSAVLLFGSALVFGATQELGFAEIGEAGAGELKDDPMMVVGLAMVITGLAFKASAAPFHMWTPDVYQGSPTPVTAFMSAATKVVALVVTLRVLNEAFPAQRDLWTAAIAGIAIASLAVGNLAALVQRDVKRMLAYSSVSHAGFMLIPIAAANELGAKALLYYFVPYCAASLGAFAVVAARERELAQRVTLDNLSGMGWERPFLGVAMWVFVLSFAGLPLTGGFFGKFYAFSAAVEADWTWLVIAGVIATAISLYYYLAIIRAMYMRSDAELQLAPVGGAPMRDVGVGIGVAACLIVTVGSFFAVQPLAELAERAAASLPF
ncbi:MAG TPA: NADH-quinone oxidoreductase subunit N [Gaiellaceae bacterium]|nr:NADH-quinone oxidoreductase subunit N [Gaiellaceae bacterium]